jgi:hypothetical protein
MDETRAREGLDHLQTGVLELIAAARALLDVAEDLVRDPGTAAVVTSIVSTVAKVVAGGARPRPGREDLSTDAPAVERIRVS